MSQTWTDDVFATGHAYDTDLGNMEANFASLKSLFSGASAPGSMAACHPWFDTTQHVLKVRNDGSTAWVGLMHGDTSQKVWVYRNAALAGWAIDGAVTDKVLALKGGATYTAGAASAGTWTISGLTNAAEATHAHTGPSHTHAVGATGGPSATSQYGVSTGDTFIPHVDHTHTPPTTGAGGTGATGAGASHNHVISSSAAWRTAAAVGTLQYLDL